MGETPPKILSCSDWGARAVHVAFSESAAEGIVIHNSAHRNRRPLHGADEIDVAKDLARSIQKDHVDGNGWADSGHHFLVSKGGVILEGRHGSLAAAREGHVVRGAHSNSNRHNLKWFGIEVEGNYVVGTLEQDLPEEQWAAVTELCSWLSFWGKFQSLNIRGHKEVAGPGHTDCPGKLMNKLAGLRDAVHNRKVQIMGSGSIAP